jgi:hypothetical protein
VTHDLEATLPVTISNRGEVIIVRWHVRPVGGQRALVDARFRGRAVEHQLPG